MGLTKQDNKNTSTGVRREPQIQPTTLSFIFDGPIYNAHTRPVKRIWKAKFVENAKEEGEDAGRSEEISEWQKKSGEICKTLKL